MNRQLTNLDVLTLAEAARFLRLKQPRLRKLAEAGQVPARQVDGEWRFLKSAVEEWLRGRPDPTRAILESAGIFKDDPALLDIVREAYRQRGRPADGELPD